MSTHSEALQDATAQLYAVFTPYREQAMSNTLDAHLLTKDLEQLSVADLDSLILQIGEGDESAQLLRRLLPRILELSIDGYHRWSMSLDGVFETLNVAGWRTWSELEQRSIENFLRALWLYHLYDVSPTGTISSADTILEAISRVTDIQPYLDVWLDVPEKSATAHIASLTVYGKKRLKDVRHWLAQPDILQRIEAAFWDCGDSNHAAMFARAVEYLRLDNTLLPA